MRYKFCNFCENLARNTPLRCIYILHFGQILVKISVLVSYTLIFAPMGVKFGTEEGTKEGDLRSPPPCQILPLLVQRVAPAGRKTSKSASE